MHLILVKFLGFFDKLIFFLVFKEIAAEYTTNKSTFERKALDMVKKHGLPRQ